MTSLEKYRKLDERLTAARYANDTSNEQQVLYEMDMVWGELTDAEQTMLSEENFVGITDVPVKVGDQIPPRKKI